MAITSTQSNVPGSVCNMAVGRYLDTGTAAAFTITTGFKPRYVRVVNLGATGLASMEWFEGMTAATSFQTITDGTASVVGTTGITVGDRGFTVGINTDVNIANEQLSWIALG
jgi:hypothetical protein